MQKIVTVDGLPKIFESALMFLDYFVLSQLSNYPLIIISMAKLTVTKYIMS